MNMKTLRVSGAFIAIVFIALALPKMVSVPYYLHLTVLALIWVVVSEGQNLIQGYTGYVSIAQGGFMGIGAYACALLSVKLGLSVWLTLPLAPIITGCFAVLVGYPSLRLRGHYFAIVTLAFNMVIYIVLFNFKSLTGGEAGVTDIPRPGHNSLPGYYYLVLASAITAIAFCWLLIHSRVGRNLIAIRQNEALADSIGIVTWRYKLFAFVASASLAGFGGGLYAHFMRFINPDTFTVAQSLNAILAVILGGSGTLTGPVIGSFVVVFLPEYLRIADFFRLIIYGFILVLATIFMPQGIVSVIGRVVRRLAKAR
jgi:branched-chain amino acid transport system permease protein